MTASRIDSGSCCATKKKSSSSSASAPERRARLVERDERQLAGVDPARALDDQRARRLPVDGGQVHARDDAAVDEIGEHAAGADRRQLVGVADEQDVAVAGRAEERVGELEREHRRLVDDDEVVVVRERVVLVALEAALERRVAERAVDRHRVVAREVAHAPRGLPRRRAEEDAHARAPRDLDDRALRVRLAGAGEAGEEDERRACARARRRPTARPIPAPSGRSGSSNSSVAGALTRLASVSARRRSVSHSSVR